MQTKKESEKVIPSSEVNCIEISEIEGAGQFSPTSTYKNPSEKPDAGISPKSISEFCKDRQESFEKNCPDCVSGFSQAGIFNQNMTFPYLSWFDMPVKISSSGVRNFMMNQICI